jgi:predicted ATPase
LTPYDLSAGEKQMLVILLTALVQDNQPAIMIMDEPELSLHTDWQKDLIDNIRRLNENVQLIIATHSPAVIMKGWASPKYVFQIEDIKTKETHELVRTN